METVWIHRVVVREVLAFSYGDFERWLWPSKVVGRCWRSEAVIQHLISGFGNVYAALQFSPSTVKIGMGDKGEWFVAIRDHTEICEGKKENAISQYKSVK